MADQYGVVANIAAADSCLRLGAKVWILWGDNESRYVTGLSRGGRHVRKWVPIKRLKNPRVAWVRPELSDTLVGMSKTDAKEKADWLETQLTLLQREE